MKTQKLCAVLSAVVLGLVSSEAYATAVNLTQVAQWRDNRGENSVNVPVGDRHVLDAFVDNPVGTNVLAENGSTRIHLGSNFDQPNEFSASRPFKTIPLTPWSFTAENNGIQSNPKTNDNDLTGVGDLPFVRNVLIVPNGLTPTLNWNLPSGNNVPFDNIAIGYFDDNTNARLRFEDGSILKGLSKTATSFQFPSGLLKENTPYVMRVFLQDLEKGVDYNRATTYINFTPIESAPDNLPIFVPTVDSNGVSNFDFDVVGGEPVVVAPNIAMGYEFEIKSGDPSFASLTLPEAGDDMFMVSFMEGSDQQDVALGANEELSFPNGGVDRFLVSGIEPSGMDPSAAEPFLVTLTFTGDGAFRGSLTPIAAAVPVPATASLLVVALLGCGALTTRPRNRTT